jgi:hypothetical protein
VKTIKNYPLLFHGTSVGWLNYPRDPNDPSKGKHGFEFGKNQFGETGTPLEVIWLTESRDYAEVMAVRSYHKAIKRGVDFSKTPLPGPGRMVYEVKLTHPKLVDLDLTTPRLDDDDLARVIAGIRSYRKYSAKRLFTPPLRKLFLRLWPLASRMKRHNEARVNGWLHWLELELCLDDKAKDQIDVKDPERWARLTAFCKCAGVDVLKNPMTHVNRIGVLETHTYNGMPDWMLFRLKKPHMVNGTLKTFRTYQFVNAYGWFVK